MLPEIKDRHVQKLLNLIGSKDEPLYITVNPEPGAVILNCFKVVKSKVEKQGGNLILGWQIHKTNNLVEAEFHAVWESQNGEILDITPKEPPVDQILFVKDDKAIYEEKQVDNIRINITNNPLVDDLISVCEAIHNFQNNGERAYVYDLSNLLNDLQLSHFAYLKNLQISISQLLESRGNHKSNCFCKSGMKYKNCCGKDLLRKIYRIK